MKIKIDLFKQSKGYCGPACLKMALSHFGINKSERELAKLTNTSRTKGCSEYKIADVARDFGFKSHVKDNSNINELKKLLKKGSVTIVDWFSPEEGGHYSVVVGFDRNNILLADPHFGKIKKHKLDWFNERWFDLPFEKVAKRRIIVIEK